MIWRFPPNGGTPKTLDGSKSGFRGTTILGHLHMMTIVTREYPLVNIQKAIGNIPFIVDLPIQNGDFQ